MSSPHLVVLAGPNGSGKTTIAPRLLKDKLAVNEFVNADLIASGLSVFDPDLAAMAAGRVMLARLRELAARRANFAFETTLASRSFAPWIAELIGGGYRFHLVFLWLNSPDLAVARVASRVRMGGHDVPEATIRRRYHAGLANFFALYRPLATNWEMADNSNGQTAMIATGHGGATDYVANWKFGIEFKRRMQMASESVRDISEILSDPNVVIDAINEATQDAVRRHKQLGVPMAIWKDGRVAWVAPEELEQPGQKSPNAGD